jgi:S-adenosylmethionine:tRNA ribosyltransferase-isomerase
VDVSDFDFDLPEALIAQEPAAERDRSRLLVVDRRAGTLTDAVFADVGRWLGEGDLLVVNDTRVFPARLVGRRDPSGGRVELFLVEEEGEGVWEALARPAARVREGDRIVVGEGEDRIEIEVVARREGGRRAVRFLAYETFWERLERWGKTPLPPYIHRGSRGDADDVRRDRERYQTVYARERGAIAAPTAGLHFTPELLGRLEAQGVARAAVTLHVGYGTFAPVRVERVEEHRVEPERYVVPEATAAAIVAAKRVVAVGTTTTRALEAAADEEGRVGAGAGTADLFMYPGYRFKAVDALVTNFHLPRSSLIMLVAAFAGRDLVLDAYRHAIREQYRFYSYGDAMLIL